MLGTNTNLEVLSLLQLLSQKYSFFQLKKPNLWILTEINPKYEGSKSNLKLKSRYSKKNFNIIHKFNFFKYKYYQ